VRRFVVVGLRGGLGNQLFQYASAYGIARSVGAELFFEDAWLPDGERWLPGLLGPNYRTASRGQLLRLGILHDATSVHRKLTKAALSRAVGASRRLRGLGPATMLRVDPRRSGHYDEEILSIDLPTYLLGWFQSERYFAHVADEVVERLRFPRVILPRLPEQGPVVALSFRRGDYVRYGWQLSFVYYERALDLMASTVPGASFLVLGDDPEFVRLATDWTTRYGPATNAYDITHGELEHLVLASECDHAVIANSSFAWWSAWLGDRRARDTTRLVVAPTAYRRAFGADIIPTNWIEVPSE
jgi:hypothetical protein